MGLNHHSRDDDSDSLPFSASHCARFNLYIIFVRSLFQKIFVSTYSGQGIYWVVEDTAINKASVVCALLGGGEKSRELVVV